MKKLRTLALALAVAVGGGMSPLTAPAQAHYTLDYVLYYCDFGPIPCDEPVGAEYHYCDGHVGYAGRPTEYSYSVWYNEC